MPDVITITTPVLVQDLAGGDVLVQSLVARSRAVVGGTRADALLELELHLAEHLPTLPPHAWARFVAAGEPTLHAVLVKLPRVDLPARMQPDTVLELSCIAIPTTIGSRDQWVLVPALDLTCFVHGTEVLERVVAAEAARVVRARELTSAEYLKLLPTSELHIASLTVTLERADCAGTFRARAQKVLRRDAQELLASVGRKLPSSPGRARPLLERNEALRLLTGLLESPARQSVLVVGDEGTGKSALFATWLDQARAREVLPDVYATSAAELMSGMNGFGEWQKRLVRVLDAAELLDAVLYFEDFSELALERRGDMAGFVRAAIEQRRVRVVGELSTRLVDAAGSRQPGLVAAMPRVVVPAMAATHTRAVLEAHETFHRRTDTHHAKLGSTALRALEDVAARYLPYEALPGSVLRLYDEFRGLHRVRTGRDHDATDEDVYAWFSARSGVPLFLLREDAALRASELRAQLDARLIGQQEAKQHVIDTLCIVKARLAPLDKPLASFLFAGPTGVGKTELARALAAILFGDEQRMVRFDMSEYADGDAAARLIHGQSDTQGALTRKVREQPFCVLLLDEIEKAHPAVFDLLLQLLGEARLSDTRGTTAFFHNSIVIMTSNLGAGERPATGFRSGDAAHEPDYRAALRAHFRPELINRIGRIIPFAYLTRAQVLPVAELLLQQISHRRGLVEAGATLEVAREAVTMLAERGFSAAYGARGMRRYVEQALTAPLARLCSAHANELDENELHVTVGPYQGAGHVLAQLDRDELRVTLVKPRDATGRARRRATSLDVQLPMRRREMAEHLRLDRVESIMSEVQTLVADLAQAERRKLPASSLARLRTRHHLLASLTEALERAYQDVCALEDLSLLAALGGEQPPAVDSELAALGARFDAALLEVLMVDEPAPHEVTLLVQELDTMRGLDLWLVSLLDAAARQGLQVAVRPDAGKDLRWGDALPPSTVREAVLAGSRPFRNVLLHVRGRYAAIRLGLEAGLCRYEGPPGKSPMLVVKIIGRAATLTEREAADPGLQPTSPAQFDVLRRSRPARVFDLEAGSLALEGGRAMLSCTAEAHFGHLDEIALAHLLLFEDEAGSTSELDRDRALAGLFAAPGSR